MALLYVRNAADDGWILVNSSEGNKIYDADGDTKVQCEESADEDIIRFDVGGHEAVTIQEGAPDKGTMKLRGIKTGSDDWFAYFDFVNDANIGFRLMAERDGADNSAKLRFRPYDDGTPGDAMIISAAGEVTKPLQPCFVAHATEDQVNIANSATILFGTVVTDQGDDFAANTFTAPVTGTYQLNLNVYTEQVDGAYTYCRFLVVTSNKIYYNGVISPSQMNWSADLDRYGFNYSLLADMDENDTAYVQVQFNAGAAQMEVTNASFFSGALIC
jgi:hypothetical protein